MTLRRLVSVSHSGQKHQLSRLLCTFAHHTRTVRPAYDLPRIRHRRSFHASSVARAEILDEKDHYATLGISRDATEAQIKAGYYNLSKKYHPDSPEANKNPNVARKNWQTLTDAYNVLRDDDKRREYDAARHVSPRRRSAASASNPTAQEFKDDVEYYAWIRRKQERERAAAGMAHEARRTRQPPPRPSGNSTRTKLRKEKEAAAAASAGSQRPLEMGFRPRSSWDPRFAKFFDDWAAKMKEHGWDPTQTTVGGPNGPTGPEAAKLMDGALLSQYIQYARREGKDPLGGLFTSTDGRGSAAGIWLKNRIAALDREEAKKAGGVWERGGSHRSTRTHAAGKRPVYSSDDTFNSPWDAPGMQGSSTETARPWWAAGPPPEGKEPHAYDTWDPNPELKGTWGKRPGSHPSMLESNIYGSPSYGAGAAGAAGASAGPVKRDYSRGHQLDERYEEDKIRMVANERRMLMFVGFAVGMGAVMAAGKAAIV